MKKVLLILLGIVGVGAGVRVAFEAGLKDGESKARHFRSALQDYCYLTGEARTLLTKYVVGDFEGKTTSWVRKNEEMDRRYSALIGQTPRGDGSRPTLDEVIADHEGDRWLRGKGYGLSVTWDKGQEELRLIKVDDQNEAADNI